MDLLQAVLLGVLQGLTEWIPVSSEGQTVLAMVAWIGASPRDALSASFVLHTGTALAVLVRFRSEFISMIMGRRPVLRRTVLVSSLFTGVTGLPLWYIMSDRFTGGFEATVLIGAMLVLTGVVLSRKGTGSRKSEEMGIKEMAMLGLVQGFSILPGVSRSGTTVAALLLRGINQEGALLTSFVISVPAVVGAMIISGPPSGIALEAGATMIAVSFAFGYASMDALIRFARKVDFSWFCVSLGLLTLVLSLARGGA